MKHDRLQIQTRATVLAATDRRCACNQPPHAKPMTRH
jgi:hypothetical protein